MAPKGYKNITLPNGKKAVEPDEFEAPLIKWAFEQFVTGTFQVSELTKELKKKGFVLSKNRLHGILRTEFLCGRIYIPPLADEKGYYVRGKHLPIVSEELFDDVQNILEGRKKKQPYKNCARVELPLRGYMRCSKCNQKLTGSGSRSRSGKKIYYYHCTKGCKERISAIKTNERFERILDKVSFKNEVNDLYEIILRKVYSNTEVTNNIDKERIKGEIAKIKDRLHSAQLKMLDGLIDDTDYRDLRKRFTEELNIHEANIQENTQVQKDFEEYLKDGLTLLQNIGETYRNAELADKQRIIGSIFPEKLIFLKDTVRTTRVNQILPLISPSITDIGVKIKGDKSFMTSHPHQG